jgi:SAM-dependent methyltransferase
MASYQDPETAKLYAEFLNSEDGKIQREILWQHIEPLLPQNQTIPVLDAGCGSGWLADKLSGYYKHISGCDLSPELIEAAKVNYPPGEFTVADICQSLPFAENSFGLEILNMVAHDLEDQKKAFKNLFSVLRPGGCAIVSIINPYYAFPVGVWKRGWLGLLLMKKPKLLLRPYNFFVKNSRVFVWKKNIPGFFYTLPETLNAALSAGFSLNYFGEVASNTDSKIFDLRYRLYRFPVMLVFKLEKP